MEKWVLMTCRWTHYIFVKSESGHCYVDDRYLNNLGKMVKERQTILDSAAARDDGGDGDDNEKCLNTKTSVSSQIMKKG